MRKTQLFYFLLFIISLSGAIHFSQKVREVPITELGHIHYILGGILWVNVIVNVPFSQIVNVQNFFFFDVIFDCWQLCTIMFLHLLVKNVLGLSGPEKAKKFYLMVGAYCYILIFVMLVTKDILRHMLVTLTPDGKEYYAG